MPTWQNPPNAVTCRLYFYFLFLCRVMVFFWPHLSIEQTLTKSFYSIYSETIRSNNQKPKAESIVRPIAGRGLSSGGSGSSGG